MELASEKNKQPHFKEHMFQFGHQLFPKPNIFEIDLHDPQARTRSKSLELIYNVIGPAIVQSASESLPELNLDQSQASSIKVQLNRGGSFPVHYDNPGPPNKRKLTCIVYLNPTWTQDCGGQLELIPFLQKKKLIPPIMVRFNAHFRRLFFFTDHIILTQRDDFLFVTFRYIQESSRCVS